MFWLNIFRFFYQNRALSTLWLFCLLLVLLRNFILYLKFFLNNFLLLRWLFLLFYFVLIIWTKYTTFIFFKTTSIFLKTTVSSTRFLFFNILYHNLRFNRIFLWRYILRSRIIRVKSLIFHFVVSYAFFELIKLFSLLCQLSFYFCYLFFF